MRYFFRFLLLPGILGVATAAQAQRRASQDLILVPELQVEVPWHERDYVLAAYNRVVFPQGSGNGSGGGQLRLGYEYFWNERWSGGATLRTLFSGAEGLGDFIGQPGVVIPGLLLRHRGVVGKYTFGQRLGTEYGLSSSSSPAGSTKSRAMGRLRLDVERNFVLGEALTLRPRLAYEAAAYLRLQREEDQAKERVVDFGNLRAEIGARISSQLDITLWAASQTQYLNTLAQFDALGQQVGGGRTNLRTPLLGLDVRLTLNAGKSELWQQLPTQH